jgi:hypothetical protein
MNFSKVMSLCIFIIISCYANSAENTKEKHIPISMGINLNEPQSQIDIVTNAQIMGDLAKSFRPFDESIFNRVKLSLATKGVNSISFESEDPLINNIFIDEYMDLQEHDNYTISRNIADDQKERESFNTEDYQEIGNYGIRFLVNRFAQKRYSKYSEYGITVNNDRTVLLKKGSYVYTTGLESAIVGDVPNGLYPLYFEGDVDVSVEGIAKFVTCPDKYPTAKKCLDIKIPDSPSRGGIKLTFTAKSDTHLKNFHLIMPTVNHEDVLKGKIVFNPDYLKYIKPFSTFRVMNTLLASPRSPFECITTYVKTKDVYSIPKKKLEEEYLKHSVSIKLLELLKTMEPESINKESIDSESIIKTFKAFKNKDNEKFYTEVEIEAIEVIIHKLLSEKDYLNIMTSDYRIQESKKALVPLKEKLVVLRKKSLEYNWNYVNPNEDYGNCLMKYSRASTDRAKLHDQFWGASYITPEEKWRGLPYEVIVELINITKSNVWINIPHNASINYVSDMANYFKENLNKDSKIFLELSNEVWNGGFASQKYFIGLANYRYEYYVTAFLDQFENYLKISKDRVVSYRNMRKGYLDYFYQYKKEIIKELEDFKSCNKLSDISLLVNKTKLVEKGFSIDEITKLKTAQKDNILDCKTFVENGYKFKSCEKPLEEVIKLTKQGISIAELNKFIKRKENKLDCEILTENNYQNNDEFIKGIKYKKGNYFEKLALEIPSMSAYWLGYTSAAKGKLKIQIEDIDDKEGGYKDVFVDRFEYIKEHKSELHSPDLAYHYSGDEIRDLEKELFVEFKKGWEKRKSGERHFDFKTNAKIYVLKNLDRAYKIMAQMAYVHRLDHVAKIWIDSGINDDNLIVTLATKQNNPNLTEYMLHYASQTKAIERIDAIATSTYFFGCFGDLKTEDEIISPHKFGPCKGISKGVLNAKTATEIIDIIRDPKNPKGVESIRKEIIAQKKVINDIDKRIQLVAYEGGHQLALSNLGINQRKYFDKHPILKIEKLALFKEAIEHKGMGEITKDLYKVWLEEDGKQFNNFYMPQSFHQWGSFGLSLSLSDMKTTRYLAASEYAPIFEAKEKETLE